MVISLTAGEAGVSGISGSSVSSSSSLSWGGGAPRAAAGEELLTGVGRGVSIGRTRLEEILGGLSGRGAAAGVLGVEVRNVLTRISDSEDPDSPSIRKLDTVVLVTVWRGVLVFPSLVAKSRREVTASMSISSSPSSFILCLTFLKKGETEWGRMVPLLVDEEESEADEESPLLPPYPSSTGGADGSTGLAVTRKKYTL